MTPATTRRPVRRAVSHTVPIAAAIAPIGWLLGVAIADSPIRGAAGWAGGPLLASGAAHFAFVDTLDRGAGLVAAWLAAVVVASRCTLYSAGLATRFADQPGWFRWLGPYFLIDQLYVLVLTETSEDDDPAYVRRYFLTVGTVLACVWAVVIGAGIVVGPVIPAQWRIDLILVVLVVSMLQPTLRSDADHRAAGAALAVGCMVGWLPLGTGLLVATAVGVGVGLGTDGARKSDR